MSPKLSIIIPCYNSESTLSLTLQSVLDQSYSGWEVIIVNDGSIDDTENLALSWVKKDDRIKYFLKSNEGLGKARNFGISKSTGSYILPLDSDNLVDKDFALHALKKMETVDSIGVVHGNAEYFGERVGDWIVDRFDLSKILLGNYIDACAIYRKSLWSECGGYDEKMPFQGHEDWDFWIALGSLNVIFFHLEKNTFKYYVSGSSMIRSFSDDMFNANQDYLVRKYARLYHNRYSILFYENRELSANVLQSFTKEKLILEIWKRIKKLQWIK